MKYKLYSLIIVLLIAACLPGTPTQGMGVNPTVVPQAPTVLGESPTISETSFSNPEENPTILETIPTNPEESPSVEGKNPTETSLLQTADETTAYLPLIKTVTSSPPSPGDGLTADHRVVDEFSSIPDAALSAAIATRVLQKRASTGGYISGQGLNCLQGTSGHADCAAYTDYQYDRRNWTWELWDPTEYAPWDKVDQFVSVVRAQSNNYDVFSMKLCFLDVWPDGFPAYRDAMLQLEREFPTKKFIWWTEALRPEWPSQNACETIQTFNQQVRQYALANNKPLLDVAAIESHAPNGSACSTGCESTCLEYAGDPTNLTNGHPGRTASIRIAKAYWWLMARITGWSGLTD